MLQLLRSLVLVVLCFIETQSQIDLQRLISTQSVSRAAATTAAACFGATANEHDDDDDDIDNHFIALKQMATEKTKELSLCDRKEFVSLKCSSHNPHSDIMLQPFGGHPPVAATSPGMLPPPLETNSTETTPGSAASSGKTKERRLKPSQLNNTCDDFAEMYQISGSVDKKCNGVFVRTGSKSGGVPVYRKEKHSDIWFEYGPSDDWWRVREAADRNSTDNFGGMRCAKGIAPDKCTGKKFGGLEFGVIQAVVKR